MVAETPEAAPAAGAIVAVGQARSAGSKLPAADLEGVKQLLTQTKAIGIILPPPDIRAIIDKTAQFVAKNGEQCCQLLLLLLLLSSILAPCC
jgi:splicing factor 3A subunit 1